MSRDLPDHEYAERTHWSEVEEYQQIVLKLLGRIAWALESSYLLKHVERGGTIEACRECGSTIRPVMGPCLACGAP